MFCGYLCSSYARMMHASGNRTPPMLLLVSCRRQHRVCDRSDRDHHSPDVPWRIHFDLVFLLSMRVRPIRQLLHPHRGRAPVSGAKILLFSSCLHEAHAFAGSASNVGAPAERASDRSCGRGEVGTYVEPARETAGEHLYCSTNLGTERPDAPSRQLDKATPRPPPPPSPLTRSGCLPCLKVEGSARRVRRRQDREVHLAPSAQGHQG